MDKWMHEWVWLFTLVHLIPQPCSFRSHVLLTTCLFSCSHVLCCLLLIVSLMYVMDKELYTLPLHVDCRNEDLHISIPVTAAVASPYISFFGFFSKTLFISHYTLTAAMLNVWGRAQKTYLHSLWIQVLLKLLVTVVVFWGRARGLDWPGIHCS